MHRVFCLSLMMLFGFTFNFSQAAEKGKEHDKDKVNKPAPAPEDRVEQLLHTLQEERKEERRAKAAEELGKFASQEFPEIVPALINALVRDDSATVRKAAIKTLAEIEPPTHEVKDALEQAVKHDKSWVVRQAARWAAWRYKPKDEPPTVPGPKLRVTSKPTTTGKTTVEDKNKNKPAANEDPLKGLKLIAPPVPIAPAENAPPPPLSVPLPGGFNTQQPPPALEVPPMLTAPRPPRSAE